MQIAVGSDHRGFELKQIIIKLLSDMGYSSTDMGCYDDSTVDYPDVAAKVAKSVASGKADQGILICGTGIGMSITANKISGIRAALCANNISASMARQHNDANILCMGSTIIRKRLAQEITRTFISSQFDGGRHTRRVDKIATIEQDNLDVNATHQESR